MFTQCPKCHARYRITDEQLAAADGQVICSQCQTEFNGRKRSADSLDELQEMAAEPYIDDTDSADEEPESGAMPARVNLTGVTEARPETAEPVAEKEIPLAIADDLIRKETPKPATNWRYLGQWALVWVLFVVMLGQGVYLYRFELSRDPQYAPLVRSFCGLLGCEVPLPRVPGRIAVLERDVRLHPRVQNALVVNATLVNQADFVQAFPLIELRMSDISGTQVAGRWFAPEEYLPQVASLVDGMLPGKEIHLLLEVIDPGEDVVSFQLNFR